MQNHVLTQLVEILAHWIGGRFAHVCSNLSCPRRHKKVWHTCWDVGTYMSALRKALHKWNGPDALTDILRIYVTVHDLYVFWRTYWGVNCNFFRGTWTRNSPWRPKMSRDVTVASTGPGVLAQRQYEYCYVSVFGIDDDKCLTYWLTRLRTCSRNCSYCFDLCSYVYSQICRYVLAAWAEARINVCGANIPITSSRCSYLNLSKRSWPMCR